MHLLFQCLGISGIIVLLYGLVAFAITQASSWFFWTLLISGSVMVATFLIAMLSRRPWAAMKELYGSRSLRSGTNAVFYSVIVVAMIMVANVLSHDFFKRIDLTENKVNTLTEQSVQLVEGLESPLTVTAFMDNQNPAKQGIKDLLRSYQGESKNFQVKFVDPDKERPLAMKLGASDGDVVVEYEGQTHLTRELTEQGITQAIIKVTRTDSPTVCFTTGHGELELEGEAENPRSLAAVKGGIENEGYNTKSVASLEGGVPSECSILVVAGPTQPFVAEESQALDTFFKRGGKGLLLLDPTVPDPRLATGKFAVKETGLEKLAENWGVTLGRDFILQKQMQLFRGMQIGLTVSARDYGNHPIADPMKGRQTVFQNVRSLGTSSIFDGTVVDLISSPGGEVSWAESDVKTLFKEGKAVAGEKDKPGPVPFAYAVEREVSEEEQEGAKDSQTRLVVIGDADFVSNNMVRSYEFNFDLFLNTLSWLQGEVEQITIRPKQLRTSAIELQPEQSNLIFYIAIIGIPMLVLIFGLDLWWIRRRKG